MSWEPSHFIGPVRTYLEGHEPTPALRAHLTQLASRGMEPAAPSDPGDVEPSTDELKEAADFVIHYIEGALEDHHLSAQEQHTIRTLKHFFHLEEGDLLRLHRQAVAGLLRAEMGLMLQDRVVTDPEAAHQADLQRALDLGYDQYLDLIEDSLRPIVDGLLEQVKPDRFPTPTEREVVLRRLQLLQTVIPIDPTTMEAQWSALGGVNRTLGEDASGRMIPQTVRDAVWRRDQGRCAVCGGQNLLEFDHIIPFSKGGSNTYRNIQLLCESCNRSKSARIG